MEKNLRKRVRTQRYSPDDNRSQKFRKTSQKQSLITPFTESKITTETNDEIEVIDVTDEKKENKKSQPKPKSSTKKGKKAKNKKSQLKLEFVTVGGKEDQNKIKGKSLKDKHTNIDDEDDFKPTKKILSTSPTKSPTKAPQKSFAELYNTLNHENETVHPFFRKEKSPQKITKTFNEIVSEFQKQKLSPSSRRRNKNEIIDLSDEENDKKKSKEELHPFFQKRAITISKDAKKKKKNSSARTEKYFNFEFNPIHILQLDDNNNEGDFYGGKSVDSYSILSPSICNQIDAFFMDRNYDDNNKENVRNYSEKYDDNYERKNTFLLSNFQQLLSSLSLQNNDQNIENNEEKSNDDKKEEDEEENIEKSLENIQQIQKELINSISDLSSQSDPQSPIITLNDSGGRFSATNLTREKDNKEKEKEKFKSKEDPIIKYSKQDLFNYFQQKYKSKSSFRNSSSLFWTDRYQPISSEEFLGNKYLVDHFSTWMKCWKHSSDDSFLSFSSSSLFNSFDMLNNSNNNGNNNNDYLLQIERQKMIYKQCGGFSIESSYPLGKSCLVYAIARQLVLFLFLFIIK